MCQRWIKKAGVTLARILKDAICEGAREWGRSMLKTEVTFIYTGSANKSSDWCEPMSPRDKGANGNEGETGKRIEFLLVGRNSKKGLSV